MSRRFDPPNEDILLDDKQHQAYKQLRESDRGPIINVKANLKTLEESLDIAIREINDFRKEKEHLRIEINTLHKVVTEKNENVLNFIGPKLEDLMNHLYHDISEQMSINQEIQDDVDNLRLVAQNLRDIKNTHQDRLAHLEDNIGIF